MSDTQSNAEREALFSEFPKPTYEEWRAVTEKSLKGASFEKKLITKTYEGFALQPMYRQEDVAELSHPQTLPGFAPYVRSTNAAGYLEKGWGIAQEINYSTAEMFNEALRYDMGRGQNVVTLLFDQAGCAGLDPDQAAVGEVGKGGTSIATLDDLTTALNGVDLTTTPLFIRAPASGLPAAALLAAYAEKQGVALASVQGWIQYNPLGRLSSYGSLPLSLGRAYDEMAALTLWAEKNAPGLRTTAVTSYPFHNSGSNATQELAFAIATGVAYLRAMQERGVSIDVAATKMGFAFAVGANLFMEIAKLRAARILWSQVVAAFGGGEEAQKMFMHVRTATWNKTIKDPYVNMLRTTVEAFGGAIGGCASMHVAPFDEPIRQPDEFSRRISRNTHLILQEECNFTRLIDPVGGSWYVETLTDTLARQAWALFQEVEKQGGMLQALQAGFPQGEVEKIAKEREKSLATRKEVLVGTNMYPNLPEKPVDPRQPDFAALHSDRSKQVQQYRSGSSAQPTLDKLAQALGSSADTAAAAIAAAQAGATLGQIATALRTGDSTAQTVTPLRIHRGSEIFEALRHASDAYRDRNGKRPQVFLATMGPIPQHKPRADFTTGFLEVGGFEMIRPGVLETPDAAAQAAIESGASIVVICSTDDTYPDIVPALTEKIKAAKADTVVLLAGYPQDHVEAFKAAGVDDFIHLRANCYEMNVQLQQKIGVSAA